MTLLMCFRISNINQWEAKLTIHLCMVVEPPKGKANRPVAHYLEQCSTGIARTNMIHGNSDTGIRHDELSRRCYYGC